MKLIDSPSPQEFREPAPDERPPGRLWAGLLFAFLLVLGASLGMRSCEENKEGRIDAAIAERAAASMEVTRLKRELDETRAAADRIVAEERLRAAVRAHEGAKKALREAQER